MSTGVMEAKWTAASRAAHKAKGGYFAGPDDTYPLKDASDVPDAWGLAGHAAHPDQVRRNIIAWAKANGHTDALPDTAKAFMKGGKQEESVAATGSTSSTARPHKKIGTLPICWLEYNARSLNGRIYPKATCDAIYRAALRKLADPNALPPTTFVSHEAANGNINTELVGAPVKVWQEGNKFWANIDLADTRVSRDMLGLAEGGYLKSGSMRVLGVELLHDRNYDLPLVVVQEGVEPEFLGIDLTTRPGLADVARIPRVLYESDGRAPYIEEMAFLNDVHSEKEAPVPLPLYLKILIEARNTATPALRGAGKVLTEAMTADRAAHQRIHDHLAGVLDSTVKPIHGSESARLVAAVESELSEEGRALAAKHAKRLALAHDEAARQMGMDCNEGYHEALGIVDPDHDGDDDSPGSPYDFDQDGGIPAAAQQNDDESQKGKHMELTEAEMLAALKAKGYTVEAPKTQEQLFQETLDAKLAEQERKFNERLAALTGTSDPQRQTLALGSGLEESSLQPENLYQEGDYLRGELAPKNWRALADRRVPWPHDKLDAKQAIAEMAPFLAYRLNLEEAAARGRHISQFIDEYEQV